MLPAETALHGLAPLDRPPEGDADALKFKAQRSMRDVEPSVAVYVKIPDVPEVG